MKIDLDKVVVCKECGILFIPKEKHYHTCPHCFVDDGPDEGDGPDWDQGCRG